MTAVFIKKTCVLPAQHMSETCACEENIKLRYFYKELVETELNGQ